MLALSHLALALAAALAAPGAEVWRVHLDEHAEIHAGPSQASKRLRWTGSERARVQPADETDESHPDYWRAREQGQRVKMRGRWRRVVVPGTEKTGWVLEPFLGFLDHRGGVLGIIGWSRSGALAYAWYPRQSYACGNGAQPLIQVVDAASGAVLERLGNDCNESLEIWIEHSRRIDAIVEKHQIERAWSATAMGLGAAAGAPAWRSSGTVDPQACFRKDSPRCEVRISAHRGTSTVELGTVPADPKAMLREFGRKRTGKPVTVSTRIRASILNPFDADMAATFVEWDPGSIEEELEPMGQAVVFHAAALLR